MKAPDVMTAGQINAELDRLDAQSLKLNDALIAAGRGTELPSETMRKTDALSLRWIANADRAQALRREIHRRMGGEYRRMGKGIKPLKTNPLKRWLIKHDFKKSQPKWGGQLKQDFGERNEGVIVEAETAKEAMEAFNAPRLPGRRYNPWYLEITEVKANPKRRRQEWVPGLKRQPGETKEAYARRMRAIKAGKSRAATRSKNPSRSALKYESGIRLARAAISAAYTAKRSKNSRLLQAKISYAQGIIEALHKVGVINTPLARTYLEGLRDLLRSQS